MKKLSIITINYNNLSGLKRTVHSVISQSYSSIEYLIIDGGSTDDSKEFIQTINSPFLKFWCSEADNGIYHAQNKGIINSTGDYILILNSGDELVDRDCVEKVMNLIDDKSQVIACDMISDNGKKRYLKNSSDTVSAGFFLSHTVYHPSVLIAKEVHQNYGLYEEKFRFVSDWAFLIKTAGIYGCHYQHIPVVLSVFYEDGISSSAQNKQLQVDERNIVLAELMPGNLFKEISSFQFYLDSKNLSFEKFYRNQLILKKKFNALKYIINNENLIISFMKIIICNISFWHKILAFKIWYRKIN